MVRVFNDKVFFFLTAKKHFGQMFNFCMNIKRFIHEVKKASKFWGFLGFICLTNIEIFMSIRAFCCTNI